jgi:hypothetical protein
MLCAYELDRQAPALRSLSAIFDALGFRLSALEEAAELVARLQAPRYRAVVRSGACESGAAWSSLRFDPLERLHEEPPTHPDCMSR